MLKRILFYIVISFGLIAFKATAETGPVSKLQEINQLMKAYKDTEALQKCQQVLFTDSLNYEVLCKTSVLHCRIGNRYTDETRKSDYFAGAKKYAEKALKLKPHAAEANYVMALAISNLATTTDAKARIAATFEIKEYLDHTLKANSKHAGAWHLLGRWHFRVANFNLAEATAANVFFGGVPQGATNEQAIEAINQAIKLEPQNLIYHYDLARIYKETKNDEACLQVLNEAICIAPATTEDLEISRRCKLMMSQMDRLVAKN